MNERAKQFMPFAALKGYYEVIRERQNIYEEKKELSEDEAKVLSEKIALLKKGMMIKITYYKVFTEEDNFSIEKNKGRYITLEGMVADIDDIFRILTIVKTKIPFDDILDISRKNIPD